MADQEKQPQTQAQAYEMKPGVYLGTGRRKTAIARVRLNSGSGQYTVNGRAFEEFFLRERDRVTALAPIVALGLEKNADFAATVNGGGITGQSGAVQLALARALIKIFPEADPMLREKGYLTRDSREVERKKPGRAGARRRFQFSKR